VRLTAQGLRLEVVQGRLRVEGMAGVDLMNVSSRLTTLDRLGSYRLNLSGDPANAGAAQLQLSTFDGALRLSGEGQWGPNGLRFRGEATANEQEQAALTNLLNIIGRRDGARSVISIG
jgi:general secretion pathway protein N